MATPQIRQNNLQQPQAETDARSLARSPNGWTGPQKCHRIRTARERERELHTQRETQPIAVKGAINYTQKGSHQSHFGLICNRQGEHSNWPFESALSVAWLLMKIDIVSERDPFRIYREMESLLVLWF